MRSGQDVRDRDADRHGVIIRISTQPRNAGERLDEKVLAGLLAPRPVDAVPGDGAVDDAGVDLANRLISQAQPLHHAGPEILDDDVGARDELLHQREIPSILKVRGEAALVPVDRMEERAVALHLKIREIEPPAELPAVRPLDLNDGCAEIGESQGARRPREELAKVEDEEPVERQCDGQRRGASVHRAAFRLSRNRVGSPGPGSAAIKPSTIRGRMSSPLRFRRLQLLCSFMNTMFTDVTLSTLDSGRNAPRWQRASSLVVVSET